MPNSNGRTHECLICKRKLLNAGGLKLHMNKKHPKLVGFKRDESKFVECSICGQRLINKKKLFSHTEKHHPSVKPTATTSNNECLICDICGRFFESEHGLRTHQTLKHGQSPVVQRKTVMRKLKPKDKADKNSFVIQCRKQGLGHFCTICNQFCVTEKGLKLHKNQKHHSEYVAETDAKLFQLDHSSLNSTSKEPYFNNNNNL